MAKSQYHTAPIPSDKMPKGIKFIVGNEAAERFSYYGMKTILVIFMTKYLMDSTGALDVMSNAEARGWYALFNTANYAFPILGSFLADAIWGKYKTILIISGLYCLGHLTLALDDTRTGLTIGLTLIAMGSGGIKPCVSAHVGDQFGKSNAHLLERVFGWFYFSINLGAFASSIMTPLLLEWYGPSVAFGVPGGLMLLATFVFWLGRREFVHIPAGGWKFVKDTFSGEGLRVIGKLCLIYAFVAMFWALFDQTGSAWVLQADNMDRNFLGIEWLPSQIQAINPILIMIMIPIFNFWIYPAINRVFKLTPMRKIAIGFFLAVPSFLIPAWIETQIAAGEVVNISVQLAAYLLITAAEVFVSITCLEFSYTQAPKKMKSLIMGFFFLSVSFGNLFTAIVNFAIQDEAVVVEGLAVSGTQEVNVEQDTTFAIECTAGDDDDDESTTSVTLFRPLPEIVRDDDDGDETPAPSILDLSIVDNPRSRITPGDVVTLSWSTEHTASCEMVPGGAVEASGTMEVAPDETTTYVLSCLGGGDDPDDVRSVLTLDVTTGVIVTSFTASAGVVDEGGGVVEVSWGAIRADSCTLLARTVKIDGSGYYIFFAMCMLVTALLFLVVVYFYKEQTYIQDEALEDEPAA